MHTGEPDLPLAAAWIQSEALVPNERWRRLRGAAAPGVWRAWRPAAAAGAPAALDRLVLAQAEAGAPSATYVHGDGRPVVEVRIERNDPAAALAVAYDVSSLALELDERSVDLLRERQRCASEQFHSERVLHDLANHFHAIELRVSFLRTNGPSASERDTLLEEIEKSGINARRRIEALQRDLHSPAPTTARATPFAVVSRAAELARRDGCALTLAPELASLPPVDGAAAELALVFVLLFDNAHEAGAAVHVDGSSDAEHVCIRVSDDGPGLAEAVRPKLWKPFFTTKGEGHRGHGLALAVKLVRQHGGSVEAHNRDDRAGARFTVKLVAARA